MNNQKGKVYLVGAGPGDIAYLTVKAYKLLAIAQVLVYDALVDAELVQLVSSDCLKLDVGKRGGKPSTPQIEINNLLVKYCHLDKLVVRLKSGDPFIFGRCTSEIEALKAANCEFEVIPGISSALAAPLFASIPLTDPLLSRCFAVFTAHELDALDWEALSRLETLVILMGGQNLIEIIHRLLQHGRSPYIPIAIIRWAGTAQQQIWTGTLETIVQQVSGIPLSPVVIIIGEVVGLHRKLQPENIYLSNSPIAAVDSTLPTSTLSSSFPLSGKTILVTRSAGQSNQFSELLESAGAHVVEIPALEIGPPSSWEALDQAIANLFDFDWLILTSSNGVDYFFARLMAKDKDVRSLADLKIAVVGEKTAQSLKKLALRPDFVPPNFVADSLVENFPEQLAGKKILFPRVQSGGREVLVKELTAKGAEVIEVAAYQSCCPDSIPTLAKTVLQNRKFDVITFASSKTVKFFCQLLEKTFVFTSDDNKEITIPNYLEGVCIASIGPQTSKTCHSLLGRVDVEAQEYTLEGLTQALIKWATNSSVKSQ